MQLGRNTLIRHIQDIPWAELRGLRPEPGGAHQSVILEAWGAPSAARQNLARLLKIGAAEQLSAMQVSSRFERQPGKLSLVFLTKGEKR